MPFRSTAQQRFMFSQHPQIAHRWADEMKDSKAKGAKEHPIKAAHLPSRVGKSAGTSNVGKRLNGGSFERGPSTIVRGGGSTVARRGRTSKFGNGSNRGTRLLEHYSKGLGQDLKFGVAMGRDLRPGTLIPAGKMTTGAKIGNAVGAATATPGRTAASLGGTAVVGGGLTGLANRNVNKGPVWTPTPVALAAQKMDPNIPVSSAAGGQVRPGVLVPNNKPPQANVAGRAAGGQQSGSIKASGAMKPAVTNGSVGTTAAMQPTKSIGSVTKARTFDPESNRQRRLGQAEAGAGLAGAASAGWGARRLHSLNRATKITAAHAPSTGLHHAVAIDRRSAGYLGAGAAGLAASRRIRRYANNGQRNREWS